MKKIISIIAVIGLLLLVGCMSQAEFNARYKQDYAVKFLEESKENIYNNSPIRENPDPFFNRDPAWDSNGKLILPCDDDMYLEFCYLFPEEKNCVDHCGEKVINTGFNFVWI